MEISRTDDAMVLAEMDSLVAGILRQVVIAAESAGSDAADRRLHPKPTADGDRLDEDWREYVRPELEHLFQSARETVSGDLARMTEKDSEGLREFTLKIPLAHFDAWLNSLNQARLALAARHAFTEADLDFHGVHDFSSERDAALFQVHLYGLLQEIMLRDVE